MTMRIVQCRMLEMPGSNDMFSRPYVANASQDAINALEEHTFGWKQIDSETCAGVAGGIIKPNAAPDMRIEIPQGWRERRLMFMMEVQDSTIHARAPVTQIITGWTNYVGATVGTQKIDPHMELFFNNSVTVSSTPMHTSFGWQDHKRIVDSSHLITSFNQPDSRYTSSDRRWSPMDEPVMGGFGSHNRAQISTLRPEDLMGSLQKPAYFDGGPVDDFRNAIPSAGVLRKSRRTNGLAPAYIASSINAIASASLETHDAQYTHSGESDQYAAYGGARKKVKEGMLSDDRFFSLLRSQSYQFRISAQITYRELCSIFPELDHVNGVTLQRHVEDRSRPSAAMCASWHETTFQAQIATTLSQAIPAIMMDLMMVDVSFTVTNDSPQGRPEFKWRRAPAGFVEVDVRPLMTRFVEMFLAQVFADLTENNQILLTIHASFTVTEDSYVTIIYGSDEPAEFVVPTYCDSLFTPIVAYSTDYVETLANDIDSIANQSLQRDTYKPIYTGV